MVFLERKQAQSPGTWNAGTGGRCTRPPQRLGATPGFPGAPGPPRCGAPPTRGSCPGRVAIARRRAARRGRSSGAGSAPRCGRASTRRGRLRRGAAAAARRAFQLEAAAPPAPEPQPEPSPGETAVKRVTRPDEAPARPRRPHLPASRRRRPCHGEHLAPVPLSPLTNGARFSRHRVRNRGTRRYDDLNPRHLLGTRQ